MQHPHEVEVIARALGELPRPLKIVVGYSGGIDSSVLLHALSRYRQSLGITSMRALHIHHGLHRQADAWAEHCSRTAASLGVEFQCERVRVRNQAKLGVEGAAREARLAVFATSLRTSETLCLAHNADDQAQTVVMHLLRGSGVQGAGAMARCRPFARGWLARPMLEVMRAAIERLAEQWQVSWVEDSSNQDPSFVRTRIADDVMPLFESLRPGATKRLVQYAEFQREAAAAQDELARLDEQRAMGATPGSLSRRQLARLPSFRRRALLRRWLRHHGATVPGRKRLVELDRQLLQARSDRVIEVRWRGAMVRSHGDEVRVVVPLVGIERFKSKRWNPHQALQLPWGTLHASLAVGSGLRAEEGEAFDVRLRRAGERCRPVGRAHSQTLKKLLQEHRVAPWERGALPVICRGERVVAVADLFVCEGEQARGTERGLELEWRWLSYAVGDPDHGLSGELRGSL